MAAAEASFKTVNVSMSFGLINESGLLTPAGVVLSTGIPSITINGLLFAFNEAPPLILIFGVESG